MKVKVVCTTCRKEEKVSPSRARNYKCCSRNCFSTFKKEQNPNKVPCTVCGKFHYKKPSQLKRNNKGRGPFCGAVCMGKWMAANCKGVGNSNYRGKMYDNDGKRLIHTQKYGRQKLGHAIAFEILGIDEIPEGYHIHHRDCNSLNDTPENLALVSASDHRWLHAQYGSAVLHAFSQGRITSTCLIEWANDKWKAMCLLNLNLLTQKLIINVIEGNVKPIRIQPVEVDELSETERGTGGWGSTGN